MKTRSVLSLLLSICATTLALPAAGYADSAGSSSGYRIICDDDNIFEVPMEVRVQGREATASGEFDGPGSAIFSVEYKHLVVVSLQVAPDDAQGDIQTLAIVDPQAPGQNEKKSNFNLKLKADGNGALEGSVSMISTDSDHMPYTGDISCTVREF